MWSDPPTPRAESRSIRTTLWRLAWGQPLRDHARPATPTFFRSRNAVTKRRNINPCIDWPGWVKVFWRLELYTGLLWLWYWDGIETTPDNLAITVALLSGAVLTIVATALLVNRGRKPKQGKMPAIVRYDSELRGEVHKIPIGKEWGFKLVQIDVLKYPHLLVSADTGQGKTSFLVNIIVWVRKHGGSVNIMDPKRLSYLFLKPVQGIDVWIQVEEWIDTIDRFYRSMMEFYNITDTDETIVIDEDAEPIEKPFHLLVIDEMGTFVEMIEEHWQKKKGGKGRAPTLRKIMQILWLGRAASHILIVGAHQANAKVMISTDSRAQYMNKIGLGPQNSIAAKLLFGEKAYKVRKRIGRGLLNSGGEFQEFQSTYIEMAEFPRVSKQQNEILSELLSCLDVPVLGQSRAQLITPELGVDVLGQTSEGQDTDPGIRTPEVVRPIAGRANAAAYLGMTLQAFDKARQRKPIDGELRDGKILMYWPRDLDIWRVSR